MIDDQHKRWRKYWKDRLNGVDVGAIPDDFAKMTCGARTGTGTPCKRRDLYRSGRCRLHGGLSTEPRSHPSEKTTQNYTLDTTNQITYPPQ